MRFFQTGDVVMLRTGGPEMTVQTAALYDGRERVYCQWFYGYVLETAMFFPSMLTLVRH